MIREHAHIVAVEANYLLVSTQLKTGCGSCQQQNTCGAGIISKAFSDRRAEFRIAKPEQGQFRAGEMVELLLPETALTKLSLLLYGTPLTALLGVAVLTTSALQWPEGAVILASLLAFGLSFWSLKRWLKKHDLRVNQLLTIQPLQTSA
ncbi:Fis family transcriptional regulator [Pseudidiomarina aestuarii]|uniref:Fis family transcriptional regulator n=1 Tax=Pseudidiomarina aestuarii TaxID=624146 RepID=A0A7Z6ZTW9_9GAMM|nr:SoxR reducing system RseC family protein [Pseudidiomarina aestuarii]RUO41191.1 Fis family transcriptional regulator [Pseudidiomarina aestuarii]